MKTALTVQHCHGFKMSIGKIQNVNVVADTGAIGGIVVVTKYCQRAVFTPSPT